MRIFNGTKAQMILPYVGGQWISIPSMSVSGNYGPTDDLISLIVTSYRDDEVAIIVSGPYELTAISKNPVAGVYAVQTLDEAIRRFSKDTPKKEDTEEKVEKEEEEQKPEEKPVEKRRGRGRPKKNPTA